MQFFCYRFLSTRFHEVIDFLFTTQMQDQMKVFREELQKKDALIQQLVR